MKLSSSSVLIGASGAKAVCAHLPVRLQVSMEQESTNIEAAQFAQLGAESKKHDNIWATLSNEVAVTLFTKGQNKTVGSSAW